MSTTLLDSAGYRQHPKAFELARDTTQHNHVFDFDRLHTLRK